VAWFGCERAERPFHSVLNPLVEFSVLGEGGRVARIINHCRGGIADFPFSGTLKARS
jgi:hypothetical protein